MREALEAEVTAPQGEPIDLEGLMLQALDTNCLLREVLDELRRPKVYRLRMTGEALVLEESPCP